MRKQSSQVASLRDKIRNASKKIKKDISKKRGSNLSNKSASSLTPLSSNSGWFNSINIIARFTYMESLKKKFGKKSQNEDNPDYVPLVNLDLKKSTGNLYFRMPNYYRHSELIEKSSKTNDIMQNRISNPTKYFSRANKSSFSGAKSGNYESPYKTYNVGNLQDSQDNLHEDFSPNFEPLKESTTARGNFIGVSKLLRNEPLRTSTVITTQPFIKDQDAKEFRDSMKQSRSYAKLVKTLKSNRKRNTDKSNLDSKINKTSNPITDQSPSVKPKIKVHETNFSKLIKKNAPKQPTKHKLGSDQTKDIFEERKKSKQFQATVINGKNYISFTFKDFN